MPYGNFIMVTSSAHGLFLYEKEGTGFWVLGTGCLQRQLFHDSLCPAGHDRYLQIVTSILYE